MLTNTIPGGIFMNKKLWMLALLFSCAFHLTVFAGAWRIDDNGWWWVDNYGNRFSNEWQWVDGNYDGIYECYYFDENGYCVTSTTTSDGYEVNADGKWVLNGQIQAQTRDISSLESNSLVLTEWAKAFFNQNIAESDIHEQIIGDNRFYTDSDGDKQYVYTSHIGTQYAYLESTGQIIGIVVPLKQAVEGSDYIGFDSLQMKTILNAKSMTPMEIRIIKNRKGIPCITPGANTDSVCRFVLDNGYTLEIGWISPYTGNSRCLIYKTNGPLKTDGWYYRPS